jgi:hypothetical protein
MSRSWKASTWPATRRFITMLTKPSTGPYREWDRAQSSLPTYFSKTHFNIIPQYTYILSSGLFPSSFSLNTLYVHHTHTCYMWCIFHSPSLNHSIIIYVKKWKLRSSSLRNFLQSPVTSYLFGPNILISTLFSNTPSLYSAVNNPNLICCYFPNEQNFDLLCRSKAFDICHIFEGCTNCLYIMILSIINCWLG